MTRQRIAILCGGSLAILYAYMIFESYYNDIVVNKLHFLGVGLAVGLLVSELRSSKAK